MKSLRLRIGVGRFAVDLNHKADTMGRGRKLQLGEPYGSAVFDLNPKMREQVRRAVLVSSTESDAEIAARMKPPIEAHYVTAMRERLEGLGVIASGSKMVVRRKPKPKPTDNLDMFEDSAAA